MRSLLLAALVLATVAAPAVVSAARSQPTDPLMTFRAFTAAAAVGDRSAMWRLLTRSSRRRIGAKRFVSLTAPVLRSTLGALGRGHFGISVSERVTGAWWLVAIVGQPPEQADRGFEAFAAYALPLHLEDGTWRVEIEGPVDIEPVAPKPGAQLQPAQSPTERLRVAASVAARSTVGTAVLWLDGKRFASGSAGGQRRRELAGRTAGPPVVGLHAVVAFALAGGSASALAWPFTVGP